ncbi:hypothetical protein VCH24_64700 [Variovorax boronicumulans]|nr:hypothetical protein VCH24_64700 [Variovorax boronicumulans]
MFIRIASVCDALETARSRLSRDAGDSVRAILSTTKNESRSLCFVPIREGCLTELWAHYMYADDRDVAAMSTSDVARVSEASGWVVLPGPEAPASQVRRLAQIVEAFHFFTPLGNLHELAHVDEQLVRTIATLQRIRPTPTEELFGEALALIPPATFAVPAPGVISIESTMPPRPQCCPQYRANPALLPKSLFVVLHGPGTKIEVDAIFGPIRPE